MIDTSAGCSLADAGCDLEPATGAEWLPWLIVCGVGVVAVICLIGWIATAVTARRRENAHASGAKQSRQTADVGTSTKTPPPPALNNLDLASDLITAVDLARSPAAVAQIERALRRLGVEQVECRIGGAFDARTQSAVEGRVGEPDRVGQVAEIVRPGWQRGTTLLRPVDVAVWVAAANGQVGVSAP